MNFKTESTNSLTIEGIEEPNIINYFTTINREEFEQTATLFTEEGQMLAPFEKPIVGREAIASYLKKEAKGMKLLPNQIIHQSSEDNSFQHQIQGKVKTSLFSVNVAWYFNLNLEQKITIVKIKLLASPQELLNLQRKNN